VPGFDFAATLEEKEKEPFLLTLSYQKDARGEVMRDKDGEPIPDDVVTFPPVLPAKVTLSFMHMNRKDLEKVSKDNREMFKLGVQIIENAVGREEWDRVVSIIGLEAVDQLMLEVFRYYGMLPPEADSEEGEDEGEDEGKVEGGQSPSMTSSTTSEPSTQTSNGSTPNPGDPSGMSPSDGEPFSQESPTYHPSHSS
jgi:hypothetical protein